MADAPASLRGPDAQGDGDGATQEDGPADPSRLTGKLDEGKQRHQCKDSRCIDDGSGGLCPVTMFPERRFPGDIHAGFDGAVDKGFLGTLSCFHDGRHGRRAEDDGQKTGGEGAPAMKEDSDKDRQAGDGESDDRNVVECQVQVGGSEESLHGCRELSGEPPTASDKQR